MPNRDTKALWHYHEATKHSYQSVRTSGHYLDFANYPLPFKIYSGLEQIPLPRDWAVSKGDAFSAISHSIVSGAILPESATKPSGLKIDLKTVASILFHTAGVTRRRSRPGGEMPGIARAAG